MGKFYLEKTQRSFLLNSWAFTFIFTFTLLSLNSISRVLAQGGSLTITGVVTDAKEGSPIPGVNHPERMGSRQSGPRNERNSTRPSFKGISV